MYLFSALFDFDVFRMLFFLHCWLLLAVKRTRVWTSLHSTSCRTTDKILSHSHCSDPNVVAEDRPRARTPSQPAGVRFAFSLFICWLALVCIGVRG